eukprot:scaffold910_cov396-Prasinococcus_capsulatus_cf.AAC.70
MPLSTALPAAHQRISHQPQVYVSCSCRSATTVPSVQRQGIALQCCRIVRQRSCPRWEPSSEMMHRARVWLRGGAPPVPWWMRPRTQYDG